MNEDKLIEIYSAGNRELCYQLMEGLGLGYLNLEIDGSGIMIDFQCRNDKVIRIFTEQITRSLCFTDTDKKLYEVSILHDNGQQIEREFTLYEDFLIDLNLSHLTKYIVLDNVNAYCFGLLPYEDLMKIVFTKSNKYESSNKT